MKIHIYIYRDVSYIICVSPHIRIFIYIYISASPLRGYQAARYTRFVLLCYFDYFVCCMLYYFDYFLCCTVLPRPIPPPLCSLPRGPRQAPPPPPSPMVILGASWGHLGVIFGHLGVFLSTSWTILGILGRLLFILGVTLTSRTPRWPQDGTKMSPRRLQHSHLET